MASAKSLIVFLVLYLQGHASNYYFSISQGDDSRSSSQAHSPLTPWRSLQKLNSVMQSLNAGDSILFKSGESFYGQINIEKSGIIFSSYGDGNKPIITGLKSAGSWLEVSPGIYESSSISEARLKCNTLIFNGQPVAMGRYPNTFTNNSGYLTFQSHTGQTSITSNQISSIKNFVGGEVVIRPQRDILDRCRVINQTSNTISYSNTSNFIPRDGYGFFFQNHINTLDFYKEWYYKPTTKSVFVFFGAEDPFSQKIEIPTVDTLVKAQSRSNLKFINLSFEGANSILIYLLGGSNNLIKDCDFLYSGEDAIYMHGSSQNTIDGCFIRFCNNNGIYIANRDNFSANIIKNCIVLENALFAGMGESGSNSYQGIKVEGHKNTVINNEVVKIGYSGIKFFFGDSNLIKNNYVSNFCFIKNDGGGIYTWNYVKSGGNITARDYHGNRVTANIIENAGECNDGTIYNTIPVTVFGSHGVYLDGNSANVQVDNNSISSCDKGIFVHDNRNDYIHHNTFFNNRESAIDIYYDFADLPPVRGMNIKSNMLYSLNESQLQFRFKTLLNDVAQLGDIDSNYYGNPVAMLNLIKAEWIKNGVKYSQNYDLNGWKLTYGYDLNSNNIDYYFQNYTIDSIVGNNRYANGTYNQNTDGTVCYNKSGTCNSTWVSGVLSGGCYRLTYDKLSTATTFTTAAISIGNISQFKNYVLSFDLKGTKDNATVSVYMRSKVTYKNITTVNYKTYGKTTLSVDNLLLSPFINESNSQLIFKFNDRDSTIYLDNINLFEAKITKNDPAKFARYESNFTNIDRVVLLGADTYRAVDGTVYTGQITLEPYSSIILFKQ